MASQEQMARASRCAITLGAPSPVPSGLYRALLSLVESVEKPGPPMAEAAKKPPVSDARTVLAPKKPRPKKSAEPLQEGLW